MLLKKISEFNNRILVIDDEESVRDNFSLVLQGTSRHEDSDLDAAFDELVGKKGTSFKRSHILPDFAVDLVGSGRQGLALVEKAKQDERPYASIFCDIRMPGWDGVETVEHIREIDSEAEIVFITAHSDYSLDAITSHIGPNINYFIKPFAGDELLQLATKSIITWNQGQELKYLLKNFSSLAAEREKLEDLLYYLIEQLSVWLNTDSSVLLEMDPQGHLKYLTGIGQFNSPDQFAQKISLSELETKIKEIKDFQGGNGFRLYDDTFILPVPRFGLVIGLSDGRSLTSARMYMIRFFLEHASLAIENCQMQAKSVQIEKLSAIGQAATYIMHDLNHSVAISDMLLEFLERENFSLYPKKVLIDKIRQELRSSTRLISDIRDFTSNGIELHNRQQPVESFFRSQEVDWQMLALRGKANLSSSVEPDLAACFDEDRLARVLRNLIVNSLEAMRAQEIRNVSVKARSDGPQHIVFLVADTGPGIQGDLGNAELFSPFKSTKKGNSGLGLSISHELVKCMGGEIYFESSEAGAQFFVRIPSEKPVSF